MPTVEVDALLEFKTKHLSKASQYVLQSWDGSNISSICSTWVGVRCTRSGHHIQDIALPSFGLIGTVAPQLGNLSFLHTLDLSGNELMGSIPRELSGCTALRVLFLSDNKLSGDIPTSLGTLPNLQVVELCNNSLIGSIPPGMATNHTSLLVLSLCLNALTGPIPAMSLPRIQSLFLHHNSLTGHIPPSVGNSTNLIDLELQNNKLYGSIPPELGFLHHAQFMLLSTNNITGAIPSSLVNCSNLIVLQLGYNDRLAGPIPSELGYLSNLQVLRLSFSNLKGAIPPSLGNCTQITDLELKADQLSGPVPRALGGLHAVKYADLSQNNLSGQIPSSLSNCSNLMAFSVESNQLTGMIPAEFARLGLLENLFLSRNQLVGELQWLEFSNMTNLQVLKLRINGFYGPLPKAIGQLKLLQGLDLSSNHFTGEIPWESLSNCTPLSLIDVTDNRLSGGITASLGKIQRLQYLYLQGNLLRGEIPDFNDYNGLNLLDVDWSFNQLNGILASSLSHMFSSIVYGLTSSNNDFSGPLPPWLGQSLMARVMDLSHNNFSGGLPESLGDCIELTVLDLSQNHLDLSHNDLSGVLPSFLATKLHRLQSLNVSYSHLSGPIPTEGVFKQFDASSFQGNPNLCGPSIRKKCPDLKILKKMGHRRSLPLKSWKGILFIAAISLALLLGLVVIFLVLLRCKLLKHTVVTEKLLIKRLAGTRRYTAQELMEATQGYSEDNLLGQGGVGMVYKGVLRDGKVVAVKKLKDLPNVSHEPLLKEMHILGKLRHRNLLQILGCVLNLDVKALVLEYMENGSLTEYLDKHHQQQINETSRIDSKEGESDYWEMLICVVKGIAEALDYLHHENGVTIIHGDVKPSNILLDSDLVPHLGDFGLAKLNERAAEAGISLSSTIGGSLGYMAPEYAYATRITTKADVYAYGVVLLEMLTGRKPLDVFPDGLTLHGWVKSGLSLSADVDSQDLEELLDPSLHDVLRRPSSEDMGASGDKLYPFHKQLLIQLLQQGVACTEERPDDRPTIRKVLGIFALANKERNALAKNCDLQ